jgi:hypothetical protein
MNDQSITNALLHLRAKTIRDGLSGLDHVNALLVLRGVDPAAQHVKRKIPQDSCAQREVKAMVLAVLKDGPKRSREVGDYFMARKPGIPRDMAMKRVYRAIYKMRDRGLVVTDGRVWRLTKWSDRRTF